MAARFIWYSRQPGPNCAFSLLPQPRPSMDFIFMLHTHSDPTGR
jgi:hypothetical protein